MQVSEQYRNGYFAGRGLGMGDSTSKHELETMLANPNLDPDFRRGLISGRQEANFQETAKMNDLKRLKQARQNLGDEGRERELE